MISSGAAITVDRDNDKNPVVALREIAEETLSPEDLREELIHSLQKHVEVDEPEADNVPRIAGEARDEEGQPLDSVDLSEEELLRALEGLKPPERDD